MSKYCDFVSAWGGGVDDSFLILNEIEEQGSAKASLVCADWWLGRLCHRWTSDVEVGPFGVFLDKSEEKCRSETRLTVF